MKKKEKRQKNSSAQIWVETIIYTLIGLTIISIVLTIAIPKIEELKDKNIIESSKEVLFDLDNKISEVLISPGNQRVAEITIKKGKLEINGNENSIFFIVNSNYKYSEAGQEIKEGKVLVKTEGVNEGYKTTFKLNYSSLNLTINSKEVIESLEASTTPYKLIILNKGNFNIDIKTK